MTRSGVYSRGDEHETEAHRFRIRAVELYTAFLRGGRAPPAEAVTFGAW